MKDPALELAFSGGIDQSQRSELLDPRASFVMLENMRSPTKGAVEKRPGFDHMVALTRVDGTSRSAGYRMFADGKKTCITDGSVIDVFSPDNEDQISRGRIPDCGLSMMKVPAPPGGTGTLTVTDCVRVGDYFALAYTTGQSVYASVVEAETGQVIVAPALIYSGSAAEIYGMLGARGSTAMLFVICSGESDIQLSTIDCSDATAAYAGWSAPVGDLPDNGGLAMAVHSIGTRVYVAYVNDSGGASQLSVVMYDGGAGGSTTVNTGGTTPGDLALGGVSGGTLWVAWNESTVVKVMGLSTTNLATVLATATTVITSASAPAFDGIAVVASSTTGAGRLFVNDADRLQMRNFTTSAGAVATSGSQVNAFNVVMSGRPFRVGSRYYGVCRGYDTTEDVAILCDLTDANAWVRPVANIAPRLASSFFACKAAGHTTREFWFPVAVQTAGTVTGVQVARFDFDALYRWRPAAHNGVTFLSGGLVSYFDGVRVAESGFVVRPPAVTMSTNGTASFTATGDGIRVVATYEQVDSAGNWHISGVSDPVKSGAFSNKENLAIVVRPLGISARIATATDPSVRITLWATPDGGESPYFFLTSLVNTLTGSTQTYNMTAHVNESGAMLMGTGELPGTGAQQDRRAPPGMDLLCSYNGFLVGAVGETIYWSGQDIGGEGTWWNPLFQQPCSGGGDIQALDCQDGTIFAWKRDRIFALAGQPPTDNGADGGLGAPVRLAVDIGAISPFTCMTTMGIFFVSTRGIELLTRSRSVEFIGEGIQDTFDAFPHVTAMTFDAASSCVYIECAAGFSAGLATGAGRTLIFDTRMKVWRAVDRRAVSASADVAAQDGCIVWDGDAYRYAWLRTTGDIYVESAEHHLDPGDVRVRMYGKTSWVHLSGIQGEQNVEGVLLLGEKVEDHDLVVGVANDYADTFVSETRDSDAIAAMAIYNPHFDIDQQTGQSVQVEIEDAAPTGDADSSSGGDAAKWVALTFIGTAKSGVKRTSTVLRGGTDG